LRLIQDFVNTLDREIGRDDLASPDLLAAWLESHGLLDRGASLTEADRQQAIEVREALRAMLLANNGAAHDADAAAILNRAAQAAPLVVHLQPDGRAELEVMHGLPSVVGGPGTAGDSSVAGAMGRLLAIVFTAQDSSPASRSQAPARDSRSSTWSRLKACRDDACQWAFYDHSKNRSGTWCSMADCGNRTKTRAFRQRARAAGPQEGEPVL